MSDTPDIAAPRKSQDLIDVLNDRYTGIANWLAENAPQCGEEQRQLDKDTVERAYWHYGYATAIKDVLALLTAARGTKN